MCVVNFIILDLNWLLVVCLHVSMGSDAQLEQW